MDKRKQVKTGNFSCRGDLIAATLYLKEEGMIHKVISEEVGVSESTVTRIVRCFYKKGIKRINPMPVIPRIAPAPQNIKKMLNSLWKVKPVEETCNGRS